LGALALAAPDRRTACGLGAALALVALLVWLGYDPRHQWTGFPGRPPVAQGQGQSTDAQPAKTLWDWLQLLIIPAILAAGGLWFSQQQQMQADRANQAQHLSDNAVALDQARESVLNTYIDRMSDMLLQDHLRTTSDQGARTIARARTLTALRRLDGDRRGLLVRFLVEAGLIGAGNTGIDVTTADLSGATAGRTDLHGANLAEVDLRGAHLNQANLQQADLHEAHLGRADLSGAQLQGAMLRTADLSGANLAGVDLSGANLSGALLAGADLRNATLSGADLSGTVLSHANLRGADLSNAYLRGVDLRGVDLRGADVSGAYLQGVDRRGAMVTGLMSGTLRYTHIFVIMMENHNYSEIIGNSDAPRINRLAETYGLAASYYGVAHPSEPNYVATIAGSTFGLNDDQPYSAAGHTLNAPTLVSQLEAKKLSWASYQESLPSPGYRGQFYPDAAHPLYAVKDNPFMFFASIQQDTAEAHKIVPFTQFAADLKRTTLANFVYIVPNLCDDMHGTARFCPPAQISGDPRDRRLIRIGDQFVGSVVHQIMNAPVWSHGNTAIIIAWDEDDSQTPDTVAGCCDSPRRAGGGHIPAIVITNHGPRGVQDPTAYNHYSLLRTVQQAFGLDCLQYTCDRTRVKLMTPLFLVSQKLRW
jgi:uncharacterized protein YjbI with pentapeptide repeats